MWKGGVPSVSTVEENIAKNFYSNELVVENIYSSIPNWKVKRPFRYKMRHLPLEYYLKSLGNSRKR